MSQPKPVSVSKNDRAAARRDGQVRVRWHETPIDIFFAVDKFHLKEWADIEAIRDAGTVDGARVTQRLQSLLGPSDPAVVRLRALFV